MEKKRILYVSQEICPYLPENQISKTSLALPKKMNEAGHQIRLFMPRFGCINERRHQLHEVIRLSGMNLIVNDMDQPLIIKVASIPTARLQVYFIDNEEYFKRKAIVGDEEDQFFKDNDERALFFCKGVLETVRKLGWSPDIIHCHGWMTSLLPLYLKKFYYDDPIFSNSKVIYSVYEEDAFQGSLNDTNLLSSLRYDGLAEEDLDMYKNPTFSNLNKGAVVHSDAVAWGSRDIAKDIEEFIRETGVPALEYQSEEHASGAYEQFYESLVLEEETVA